MKTFWLVKESMDLDHHALDGLFMMVGEEEKKYGPILRQSHRSLEKDFREMSCGCIPAAVLRKRLSTHIKEVSHENGFCESR